jgi:hypothetical protein
MVQSMRLLIAIFFAVMCVAKLCAQFIISLNAADRIALTNFAQMHGMTNVADIIAFGNDTFTVFAATNRVNDLVTTRTLQLVRSLDEAHPNSFLVQSNRTQTNFLIRVQDQEKSFFVGDHTPVEFAQAAIKAFLDGRISTTGPGMASESLVGCERPTDATDIATLLFGKTGYPRKCHCRFRNNYLKLLTIETVSHDTSTIIGRYAADDIYLPAGHRVGSPPAMVQPALEETPSSPAQDATPSPAPK